MHWRESLTALYNFKSSAELNAVDAVPLFHVIDSYLAPPSRKAMQALRSNWPYKVKEIPTNILGLAAMELAMRLKENERRRDGSLSIVHELTQNHYLRSFPTVKIPFKRPDLVSICAFLHDLGEDFGITPDYVKGFFTDWLGLSQVFDTFPLKQALLGT